MITFRRLTDCVFLVAHRQLPGSYPFVVSIRSMECVADGRLPMSRRNRMKPSGPDHLSHTDTPA
jgi:hypothetical protein